MTSIAIASSHPRFPTEFWNASAAPEYCAVTDDGSVLSATVFTSASALPSETLGATSNEIVTAGSCPEWLIDNGPSVRVSFATVLSGTSCPVSERT
jgi:hypothetical protein